LLEVAGIDFKKFNERGIEMEHFGEVFTTSGLVLNENVKWVTFHGSYDFAYFIKALSNQSLPEDENIFNELLGIYFCNFYDVRQMIKNVTWLKGSLSRISSDLDIKRIGQTHQAGSDSLVTSKVFFKLLANFNDHIDVFGDKNKLFGFSYKAIDDYDWNNNFVNNFSNFSMPPYMNMPGNMNINMNNLPVHSKAVPMPNINPINNMNGINNLNSMNNINKSASPMYFQNNFNYQNGNSMNNMPPNMMFYGGNGNMNGFNPMYPQQMDYAYYGNYYPGAGASNNGSFKNGQTAMPSSKDTKFVQN
jgi:CCR4-NOT transcription complex subunit 7/8